MRHQQDHTYFNRVIVPDSAIPFVGHFLSNHHNALAFTTDDVFPHIFKQFLQNWSLFPWRNPNVSLSLSQKRGHDLIRKENFPCKRHFLLMISAYVICLSGPSSLIHKNELSENVWICYGRIPYMSAVNLGNLTFFPHWLCRPSCSIWFSYLYFTEEESHSYYIWNNYSKRCSMIPCLCIFRGMNHYRIPDSPRDWRLTKLQLKHSFQWLSISVQ